MERTGNYVKKKKWHAIRILLRSRIGCETPADKAMFSVLELVSGSKWHAHLSNTLSVCYPTNV